MGDQSRPVISGYAGEAIFLPHRVILAYDVTRFDSALRCMMSWSEFFGFAGREWPEFAGFAAAVCMLVVYYMKTMIPLRIAGIVANILFVGYGYFEPAYPSLVMYTLLLPLNSLRLYQMIQLTKKIEIAAKGDLSMDWLKPFMTRRKCRAGDVLFHRGDVASELYYTLSGAYQLEETGTIVSRGEIVGELAFIAPQRHRTLTFKCLEDGELLTIDYAQVRQLYFQNPTFGFYFLQLASGRLFRNIERLETALAQAKVGAAVEATS
jgi:CRP/FNR family transcriptional regulator, cyclic AMP receptor protein